MVRCSRRWLRLAAVAAACSEMPVLAASLMSATRFLPDRKASLSVTSSGNNEGKYAWLVEAKHTSMRGEVLFGRKQRAHTEAGGWVVEEIHERVYAAGLRPGCKRIGDSKHAHVALCGCIVQ